MLKYFNKLNMNAISVLSGVIVLSFSGLSWAGEAEVISDKVERAGSMSSAYLTQFVMGLLIVLLCIVVLAWLAKRFNRMQSSLDGSLKIIGGLSLGARERIVLVQVGKEQLLLGVAPGRVNKIHVVDPLEIKKNDIEDQSFGKGFAKQLSAALSRDK